MIKALRKKIIIITMGLFTVIFVALFVGSAVYDHYLDKLDTLDTLEWMAEEDNFDQISQEQEGILRAPVYRVKTDQDGRILTVDATDGKYDMAKVQEIVKGIQQSSKQGHRWKNYLYYINSGSDEKIILYTDLSVSNRLQMRELAGDAVSLVVGFCLFFGVSIYLSRFVTRPAEEMLKREKQFISDASHELKTPVAAIRINAQVMSASEKHNRFLDNILSETERMNHLIRELLTFSYLEEKGKNIEKEEFSLSDAGEELVLSMECEAFEKDISLDYDIKPDIKYTGNEDQIKRLIAILLDNAIKHTQPNGKIKLSINMTGKKPHICVENTGEGIPPEELPHIFERFYRGDPERGADGNHFGLGLSIAKSIVEAHSGSIEVKSEIHKNTVFECIL